MTLIRGIFYKFFSSLVGGFSGINLLFHGFGILATIGFVIFGLDWNYFVFFKQHIYLQYVLAPVIYLGFGLPILLPLVVYLVARWRKNLQLVNAAYALAQAGILGLSISSFYKVFTGRVPPEYVENLFNPGLPENMSTVFQFGIWQGGIVYGWPSGHTMVAVAMVVSLIMLYPRQYWLKVVAVAYAVYIAVGMSTNLHWVSDVLVGVVMGVMIGRAVGKTFVNRFTGST